MAATRKLQGEIDRCLKKVAEGVETFEDIWKKVHNATNSNQKEKYEADLKKEIKKLQRLRDQIKSWIASAEIKDKSALLENRRLIETQMERFKIVERETKTKAYSKEGLGAAQKMDPAQRIKDEARNWLTSSISSLQIQIDQYESEIESLLAGKKKRLDRDKQDRMDELRSKLDRHKFHVTKLETLLRLLDNDGVEAEQVNKIKDDVEYYIESSQDPDFEENEFIYDDIIGLDEVELSGTATTDSNNSNETGGSPSSIASGGSPVQSPPPSSQQLNNCSGSTGNTTTSSSSTTNNANNLNYSSDSTSVDITAAAVAAVAAGVATADKRNKNDTNASSKAKQPVKPTAVRANNNNNTSGKAAAGAGGDSNLNNSATSNNLNNSTAAQLSQQQQQQQQQQSNKSLISSTPSKNQQQTSHASSLANSLQSNVTTSSVVNSTQQQQHTASVVTLQQQQQQHSNAPSLNNSSTIIQAQSVIQATPPIAFAAVAKNNTSHLENGPVHPATSYTMAAPTVASIVGSNAQQQAQHTNLQTNSSHQISDSSTTHNNTSNNTSIGNTSSNAVTSGVSVDSGAPLVLNAPSNNNSNSLANRISPNGIANVASVLANTSRGSPGLLSPKHMNGPLNHNNNNNNSKGLNVSVSGTQNNTDTMSTLKTMAQDAINRSGSETNMLAQGPTVDTRQQQQQQQQNLLQQQQQQQQQQSQHFSPAVTDTTANNSTTNGPTSGQGAVSLTSGIVGQNNSGSVLSNTKPTNEAHIPPLLGVAPLGPSPLHKDHQLQFQMMEAAYYHLPMPSDSEKLTTYIHRNPVQTPPHYPQSQLPHYDTVEFFQRLSTETLFFVFYYMEGSKAQYLAAKALKKQSWRFHTKYMMWFQRHEEPKIINDDYEQGTYIYFDYEKWSQRKKEGFTFEYKYLEDKELN